jgi:hypothetical protein
MTAQQLNEQATELRNRLTDPNTCSECWQIRESLRPLTLSATFANGNVPTSCLFMVCRPCYLKGAPECRERLALVCRHADPDDADEPVDIGEVAKDIVLLANYSEEYKSAARGRRPKEMN